jgi:hypothetical protein
VHSTYPLGTRVHQVVDICSGVSFTIVRLSRRVEQPCAVTECRVIPKPDEWAIGSGEDGGPHQLKTRLRRC